MLLPDYPYLRSSWDAFPPRENFYETLAKKVVGGDEKVQEKLCPEFDGILDRHRLAIMHTLVISMTRGAP